MQVPDPEQPDVCGRRHAPSSATNRIKPTHRFRNEPNSKRTELITIVGYAVKVLGKNEVKNVGKIFVSGADSELFFYSSDEEE